MTKVLFNAQLLLLIAIAFLSCKKSTENISTKKDYSDAYQYYPSSDNNLWYYHLTVYDSNSVIVDTLTEKAEYILNQQRMNYYRKDSLWSYAYWLNTNNQLACCNNVKLINYDLLDCQSDSVLIYSREGSTDTSKIYQHCQRKTLDNVQGYKSVPCVKTFQMNTNKNGSSLRIIRYFGYKVGLIYEEETAYNARGKMTSNRIRKLVAHRF